MPDNMKPINIDLRDLTPELLERCRSHMVECDYRSPCVIGVLMTPAEQDHLANWVNGVDRYDDDVGYFVKSGAIVIPEEQYIDAVNIQYFFDNMEWEDVLKIANKYMTKTEDQNK